MTRKRALIGLGVLALALGGAALGLWLWNRGETADVRGSSTVEFVVTDEPGATATTPTPTETGTEPVEPEPPPVPWPTYQFDAERSGYAAGIALRPPFRQLWVVRGRNLIEFPPAVGYGRVYVGTNPGRFLAIEAETGKIAWQKSFKRCIASSPAIADGVVYQALMDPSPCGNPDREAPGYLAALDADTGDELWRFEAGVIESSPLVENGVVYFGSWDGRVYAVDLETHEARWSFQTGDEVKAAPAYANGTIYVGSYDGKLYALDAATGDVRWTFDAGGRISGAVTVIDGIAYVSTLDEVTFGVDAATGKQVWRFPDGKYTPIVADAERVYVVGYTRIYGLAPRD